MHSLSIDLVPHIHSGERALGPLDHSMSPTILNEGETMLDPEVMNELVKAIGDRCFAMWAHVAPSVEYAYLIESEVVDKADIECSGRYESGGRRGFVGVHPRLYT